MLLAVDIGNTNTVLGVFEGETLRHQWRIATDSEKTADEFASLALNLFSLGGFDARSLTGAIVASVVPAALSAVTEASRRYLGLDAMIFSSRLDAGIRVSYDPPAGVGADRIANAVAAIERYGAPAIVVDFGTGTNFDVIDRDGTYIGGAIAPGIEISTAALFARTAQLPHVALVAPPSAIGTSTVTSLQSGIMYGYAGLVEGLVGRILPELGEGTHVIATGGLASVVAPYVASIEHIDVDLTLVGLRLIYERSQRAS